MGARSAKARQSLTETWGAPIYNGQGGTAFQDKVIGTQTVNVDGVNTTFVAARTWVQTADSSGWALVMRRYQYDNGGVCISTGPCSFVYPGAPSDADYFVPTAMKIVRKFEPTDGTHIYVLVTGYSPAPTYGNTDFRTVCFNGDMVLRWDQKFSAVVDSTPPISGPDEYAVDIDAIQSGPLVAAVTGNTYNGSNWDVQTVMYKVDNGKLLHSAIAASSSGGDDFAAGCRVFGASIGDWVTYVVATMSDGVPGNDVEAFRYEQAGGGPVSVGFKKYTQPGGQLRMNAMDGLHLGARDVAVGAGKVTGIDFSHMLLIKFDFNVATGPGWTTTFTSTPPSAGPQANEALAVKYYPTLNDDGSVGDLYAMAGYGKRDGGYGLDSLACLHEESVVGTAPALRWSAWLNNQLGDPTVDVFDTCTGLDMDENAAHLNDLDRGYHVYVIGQRPTTTTNLDWRVAVYTSENSTTPADPAQKGTSGSPLQVFGSATGLDVPLKVGLYGTLHNFVVAGNVYDGPITGDDVAAHRYQYTPLP